MTDDYLSRQEYLDKCQELAGDDWAWYDEHYSFIDAQRDGLTPEQAIKDCKQWLEG